MKFLLLFLLRVKKKSSFKVPFFCIARLEWSVNRAVLDLKRQHRSLSKPALTRFMFTTKSVVYTVEDHSYTASTFSVVYNYCKWPKTWWTCISFTIRPNFQQIYTNSINLLRYNQIAFFINSICLPFSMCKMNWTLRGFFKCFSAVAQ